MKNPNLVYIFADQWRASATDYNGDPNVQTPNIDKLAQESINFTNTISNCPICTPYRASLMTGQYPLTTGIFMNDLCLAKNVPETTFLAEAYKNAGYETDRLERPQLLMENGRSLVLYCAAKPENKQNNSYNIHIPLQQKY